MTDAGVKKKRKLQVQQRFGGFLKQLDVNALVSAVAVIGILGLFWGTSCEKAQQKQYFPVKLTAWDPAYEWTKTLHGAFDAVSQACELDPDPTTEPFKISLKHLHQCARQSDLQPYWITPIEPPAPPSSSQQEPLSIQDKITSVDAPKVNKVTRGAPSIYRYLRHLTDPATKALVNVRENLSKQKTHE